jgi:hypothetical protein
MEWAHVNSTTSTFFYCKFRQKNLNFYLQTIFINYSLIWKKSPGMNESDGMDVTYITLRYILYTVIALYFRRIQPPVPTLGLYILLWFSFRNWWFFQVQNKLLS